MSLNKTLLIAAAITLSGCSSVTIQPQSSATITSKPSYEESKPYFIFGLAGEHRIDTKAVCKEQQVLQMQSQLTVPDALLGLITLGIYTPHTAKVWCASPEKGA